MRMIAFYHIFFVCELWVQCNAPFKSCPLLVHCCHLWSKRISNVHGINSWLFNDKTIFFMPKKQNNIKWFVKIKNSYVTIQQLYHKTFFSLSLYKHLLEAFISPKLCAFVANNDNIYRSVMFDEYAQVEAITIILMIVLHHPITLY